VAASLLRTKRKCRVSLFCAFVAIALPAHALDAIDADGPDFVESSEVVAQGYFQYEVDFTYSSESRASPGVALFSTSALLKYGIVKGFEIRVAPNGYMRQNGEAGWGDTAVGIKWQTQDRDAAQGKPAVSWILHIDTPSGAAILEMRP
jgi:hypothetical protein